MVIIYLEYLGLLIQSPYILVLIKSIGYEQDQYAIPENIPAASTPYHLTISRVNPLGVKYLRV
jgi:hypothetical protein